ncbi:NADH:flavin oxidoreductase/NADH oxidase [Gymnopus androsaceus JB14]|uniref:NADH:flavin oxidoreductase/NADH oxidase n=1 Tax=Gymnopus androsaceus JB14 TaxID=1447944 RepID=A0A6A4I763_9AGAR|nr:NADH:flavin oxidoreductase/NADH oxidase [Gymnopus androsaceus JB14]
MSPALFQPIKLGTLDLQHRIVLAPLTRVKATEKEHVPTPIMAEYYAQRASTPGTLLIAESALIAARASGYFNTPGIWSKEQTEGWKVTDVVHAKGSFIFLQLRALGRTAKLEELHAEDPSLPYVSASDIPLPNYPTPRPLTIDEIAEYTELFATAAKNSIEAGFDGVEIHGANGYLIDQFTQDVSNKRTDAYGGSIENRCRFALQVVDKVVQAIGAERTGIRLSPWATIQGMGMDDPRPTFTYLAQQIKHLHPSLAYIHVIQPRINGNFDVDKTRPEASNDFLREIWHPKRFITAGGYKPETAFAVAEKYKNEGELVAFGRYFLSTPDLPERLRKNTPLNPYNRATFYLRGDVSGLGYTDYPFATTTNVE